jgi:RNase adaptor protein for sRNA GlmZ degradation
MDNNLTVIINSFSYKRDLPHDNSGNGGGFIFDCRAIHNPGRYEEYKKLTGKDKEVIQFLIKESEMQEFLSHVFAIADQSVSKYIERQFSNLMISFGCTGGQHRSVYCAENLAEYLKNKYKINVIVHHIEQEILKKERS